MPTATLRTRRVRVLTIHLPVSAATLRRLAAGEAEALDAEPAVSAVLAIIGQAGPLGDFGAYRGVVELGLGWELFTPASGARPTLGIAETENRSPTVILRVHVRDDAPGEADAAIASILAAHPWEVPVIEMATTELLLR